MTKRIEVPKPTVGYGYVGQWGDGRIGWFMPTHVDPYSTTGNPDTNKEEWRRDYLAGTRSFLCRIIVEPVLDKSGRPITKIHAEGE